MRNVFGLRGWGASYVKYVLGKMHDEKLPRTDSEMWIFAQIEKSALLLAEEPLDPKCFTRCLEDLTCFWESSSPPSATEYGFFYVVEGDAPQRCNVSVARTPWNSTRFSCIFPPQDTPSFTPLHVGAFAGNSSNVIHARTIMINQVVLLDPPSNLTARAPESPGQLAVSWQPPGLRYLESSLRYEVAFAPEGAERQTVDIPDGHTECLILNLRGRTRYTLAVRVRPDGVSYSGYWSAWSAPVTVLTPHDLDPLILSLSLILVLIVVLLALFALLTHRRFLKKKLWPVIPSPEHKFEGLFTLYKGNFQLWLGQRNAYPWWSMNPGYLEEQPTTLEVLSEGRESKVEGPVPPLPPKAQGLVLPTHPELPVEPQDDYLVLDEQLMPCSLGEDSLLLPEAQSSAGSESPHAMEQELGPPGATPEPVPEEGVSSSSSFEYTVFDPSSELLAPCGHQRPLKYSYLLVSDSGISTDYNPLGTSTHQPNLYTNLCQDGCQAQPFPASYVVCS
ncbi:erythropoietin receptor isoform X2 [Gopherus evgoodei]|uniref:Erythropoietin receptor n=1 Tax=Gopherus evgoodei TaxID=1825980 RepID=A0A8C4WKY3_9SAUR|nr:erythropoietin receptor isoform X2 [Gopherus evgoodei]